MRAKSFKRRSNQRTFTRGAALLSLSFLAGGLAAHAQDFRHEHDRDRQFWPGNLVVSRTVYDNNPRNVKTGTILPPNCASTTGGCSASTGAPFNSSYPLVWNNVIYDPSL